MAEDEFTVRFARPGEGWPTSDAPFQTPPTLTLDDIGIQHFVCPECCMPMSSSVKLLSRSYIEVCWRGLN